MPWPPDAELEAIIRVTFKTHGRDLVYFVRLATSQKRNFSSIIDEIISTSRDLHFTSKKPTQTVANNEVGYSSIMMKVDAYSTILFVVNFLDSVSFSLS